MGGAGKTAATASSASGEESLVKQVFLSPRTGRRKPPSKEAVKEDFEKLLQEFVQKDRQKAEQEKTKPLTAKESKAIFLESVKQVLSQSIIDLERLEELLKQDSKINPDFYKENFDLEITTAKAAAKNKKGSKKINLFDYAFENNLYEVLILLRKYYKMPLMDYKQDASTDLELFFTKKILVPIVVCEGICEKLKSSRDVALRTFFKLIQKPEYGRFISIFAESSLIMKEEKIGGRDNHLVDVMLYWWYAFCQKNINKPTRLDDPDRYTLYSYYEDINRGEVKEGETWHSLCEKYLRKTYKLDPATDLKGYFISEIRNNKMFRDTIPFLSEFLEHIQQSEQSDLVKHIMSCQYTGNHEELCLEMDKWKFYYNIFCAQNLQYAQAFDLSYYGASLMQNPNCYELIEFLCDNGQIKKFYDYYANSEEIRKSQQDNPVQIVLLFALYYQQYNLAKKIIDANCHEIPLTAHEVLEDYSLLHLVCAIGNIEMINYTLNKGANLNRVSKKNFTITDKGVETNIEKTMPPLFAACYNYDPEVEKKGGQVILPTP